jgi:hypothetical protein
MGWKEAEERRQPYRRQGPSVLRQKNEEPFCFLEGDSMVGGDAEGEEGEERLAFSSFLPSSPCFLPPLVALLATW